MVKIEFPKRIKYSKDNPVIDFYKKVVKKAFEHDNLDGLNVTAVCIHPKDYSKLKELLTKHVKKNFKIPYIKIQFEVGMFLLDLGPRTSKLIKQGTVEIDEDNLYG
jgi:hypothetical protein